MDGYLNDRELQHWGIKGMRWGVRRYQNKDGTLTPAGKKRYDDDGPSDVPKKSKHRLKLEEKYRSQGMNQENAERAAARRIKTEKILGAAAAVTVTAATAYVINKNLKDRTDKILKSGTTIQRITGTPDEDLNRAFYAANHKSDKVKYKGMYGRQLKEFGEDAHNVTLRVDKDIKVASRNKAAEVFTELYKNDPEFKATFDSHNSNLVYRMGNPVHARVMQRAKYATTDKQLKKSGYEAFNIGLVAHDRDGNSLAKKFYNKLKEQGYDAIEDINDKKYSGYGAKNPLIIFNKADKISISSVKKMTDEQIASNANKAIKKVIGTTVVKTGAAFAGSATAANILGMTTDTFVINNYRREHPNTKLSDREIIKMLNTQ